MQKFISEVLLIRSITIVNAYTFVAAAYCFTFGLIFIYITENIFLANIHLIACLVVIANYFLLKVTKNYRLATWVILATGTIVVTSLFIDGGWEHTGYLWTFAYLPYVYFLGGKEDSYFWVLVLYLIYSIIALFHITGFITIAYSDIQIISFFFSLATFSVCMYLFEKVRDRYEQDIFERLNEIEIINKALDGEKRITEERNAKDKAILSGIGDGVFVIDKDEKIVLFNKASELLTGYSAEEALHKNFKDILKFVNEETGEPNYSFITNSMNSGEITTMANHTELIRKDGSKIPVADSASPVVNGDNEIFGCVIVFRDVSQDRIIDKAKTEFVSLATHQLRTPPTAIKWSLNLFESNDENLTELQKKLLHQIHNSNERMIHLVNSLLNISRIELGTYSSKNEIIKLNTKVEKVLSDFEQDIQKKRLRIIKQFQTNLPDMTADKNLVYIVIHNLLSNAIKYSPVRGQITIELNPLENGIEMVMSDEGHGIPDEQQHRVFSKLFRADNAQLSNAEGTGLGLYLVKTIIDMSKGKIRFNSKENSGTTFYVEFPIEGMIGKNIESIH